MVQTEPSSRPLSGAQHPEPQRASAVFLQHIPVSALLLSDHLSARQLSLSADTLVSSCFLDQFCESSAVHAGCLLIGPRSLREKTSKPGGMMSGNCHEEKDVIP